MQKNESAIPYSAKVTLINVAGVCHGPEKYARSPLHDRVGDVLEGTRMDIEKVFIPSAVIRHDYRTNENIGIQRPPSFQYGQISKITERAARNSRIPIALAHSSGSIATVAALKSHPSLSAVIVSPTILDPVMEIFKSPGFAWRFKQLDSHNEFMALMSPVNMSYSTFFPHDHFNDHLYQNIITGSPEKIEEINHLIEADRMHIFLGERDWNEYGERYPKLLRVNVVKKENHSFEKKLESAKKVSDMIMQIFKMKSR